MELSHKELTDFALAFGVFEDKHSLKEREDDYLDGYYFVYKQETTRGAIFYLAPSDDKQKPIAQTETEFNFRKWKDVSTDYHSRAFTDILSNYLLPEIIDTNSITPENMETLLPKLIRLKIKETLSQLEKYKNIKS